MLSCADLLCKAQTPLVRFAVNLLWICCAQQIEQVDFELQRC